MRSIERFPKSQSKLPNQLCPLPACQHDHAVAGTRQMVLEANFGQVGAGNARGGGEKRTPLVRSFRKEITANGCERGIAQAKPLMQVIVERSVVLCDFVEGGIQ
jgi:hypothetical protein